MQSAAQSAAQFHPIGLSSLTLTVIATFTVREQRAKRAGG
jgi:hypothetical protein